MKRFLICLPLCLGLVALPALSTPSMPVHNGQGCTAELAADVSMMTRHAALKSAAEAAIAGQAKTPCRDDKHAAPEAHASHTGHRSHRDAAGHRRAARGMCAASLATATLTALPELVLAHHGPGTPRAPLADLADLTPAGPSGAGNAHC